MRNKWKYKNRIRKKSRSKSVGKIMNIKHIRKGLTEDRSSGKSKNRNNSRAIKEDERKINGNKVKEHFMIR